MKRLFVVLCALVFCSLFSIQPAHASGGFPDWQAGEPVAQVSHDYVTSEAESIRTRACTPQIVQVRNFPARTECVTVMNGWRYAMYTHFYYQLGMQTSEEFFVVGIGSDTKMYVVEGMPTSVMPLDNPGGDTLVYHQNNDGFQIYRHFLTHLERSGDGYRLSAALPDAPKEAGAAIIAGGAAISQGGDWLVAETSGGIIRLDLRTLDLRHIAPITTPHDIGMPEAMELAVSDDGETIFVGGRLNSHRQFWVVTVHDGCDNTCSRRDLTPLFDDNLLPSGWPVGLRLSPHGRRLDFYLDTSTGSFTRASLYPYGSAPASLQYLALGDSYSSGEGDAGSDDSGEAFYLPHTDTAATAGQPAERCHVSRRSYPFLLASFAGLNGLAGPLSYPVESVACNNAHIGDIATADDTYVGQDNRLKGLSTAKLDDMRTSALTEFIPGRIQQSDFVDEYQPRALSVGIGGNDVQFARVIEACASSFVTCSYASDPIDRRNVGESIKALYPRLVAMYTELARLDPSARIYAVGYPRFVNETNQLCPVTVNLDLAERTMIDAGVRYLNAVVQAAATSAGVGYLDIQDALVGHRLCDDPGGYVNGINFGNIQAQEQFHPNGLGHAAEALTIERQLGTGNLAGTSYCLSNIYPCPNPTDPPSLPTFFGDESVRPTYVAVPSELVRITDSEFPYLVSKGVEFIIQTSLLAADSTVRMELHSSSLDLGTATVGEDGTLSAAATLPDSVSTGYHTINLYGTSPSGEAVDIYQIVYVGDKVTPQVVATVSSPTTLKPTSTHTSVNPLNDNVVLNTIKLLPATFGRNWILVTIAVLLTVGTVASITARTLWRRRPS